MRAKYWITLPLGLLALGLTSRAAPLEVGAKAPAVTGTTASGTKLDFGTVYPKGYTLVFFFPMANSYDSTVEGKSLAVAYPELTAKGVTVIGVSVDDQATQAAFKAKNKFPFVLISDVHRTVVKAFGVPLSEEWGTGPRAKRESFLIDSHGVVIWRTLDASLKGQPAEVLKALQQHRH